MPISQRTSPYNFYIPYEESESFDIDEVVEFLKEAPASIGLQQIDDICRDSQNGQ